jgi:acetyltransferase-like isoleucine patch superfamily enzyme
VSFGTGCVLDNDLTVEVSGVLRVGERVIFGHHCTVAAVELVEIGDDCMLAEMVSIRDHDHAFRRTDLPYREQGHISAPVRIGRNVWLGAKVTVVKGVTIGDNVVVGANAVVTRNLPANVVAAGVPARVIRRLDAVS